jgi:3',5'-cyclic AMP phosphodiesterase CpdA
MTTAAAFRLAHVSDLHVGSVEGDSLQTLITDLAGSGADATIVTGDLTMRARSREYTVAVRALQAFPAPTLVVMGNHDVPLLNPLRRMAVPYQKFRAAVAADLDPVLDLTGARIQGLGSMPRWRWKSGRVSDRQTRLIRSTFSDAPEDAVRIVAMHHPPSSDHLARIAGHSDLEKALVGSRVDIVLAGHTHVPQVRELQLSAAGRRHRVLEVVAGTATSDRTRGVPRSWWLLELTSGEVRVIEHVGEGTTWRTLPPRSYPLG